MNERLSQLDTKLLCFRSPQHLSRHLLDATILLLLEKEALFTTVLVKKKKKRVRGLHSRSRCSWQYMTAVL